MWVFIFLFIKFFNLLNRLWSLLPLHIHMCSQKCVLVHNSVSAVDVHTVCPFSDTKEIICVWCVIREDAGDACSRWILKSILLQLSEKVGQSTILWQITPKWLSFWPALPRLFWLFVLDSFVFATIIFDGPSAISNSLLPTTSLRDAT